MTPKQLAVIDAAILWALCPDAGGYRHTAKADGYSIEDTCELLSRAVDAYLGKSIKSPSYPRHWTVTQMRERVAKLLADKPTAGQP